MVSNIIQAIRKAIGPTTDWKRVVRLELSNGNVLTIITLDYNIQQYRLRLNDDSSHAWFRYSSMYVIKDQSLIKTLEQYYSTVVRGRKVKEGWVKDL